MVTVTGRVTGDPVLREGRFGSYVLARVSVSEVVGRGRRYETGVPVLVIDSGLAPEAAPRDADWGERYFHLTDPDGHELSFARPL